MLHTFNLHVLIGTSTACSTFILHVLQHVTRSSLHVQTCTFHCMFHVQVYEFGLARSTACSTFKFTSSDLHVLLHVPRSCLHVQFYTFNSVLHVQLCTFGLHVPRSSLHVQICTFNCMFYVQVCTFQFARSTACYTFHFARSTATFKFARSNLHVPLHVPRSTMYVLISTFNCMFGLARSTA
jgi:hypothetical protein